MGEIFDAIKRHGERKEAIGVVGEGENIGRDGQRHLLVGMDLDLHELHLARVEAVKGALNVVEARGGLTEISLGDLGAVIASAWVDGITTGMMIEEARDE